MAQLVRHSGLKGIGFEPWPRQETVNNILDECSGAYEAYPYVYAIFVSIYMWTKACLLHCNLNMA